MPVLTNVQSAPRSERIFEMSYDERTAEEVGCLDARGADDKECGGAVEYRESLSGTGTWIVRCDKHFAARLKVQRRLARDYGVGSNSAAAPYGFDPSYAGESW